MKLFTLLLLTMASQPLAAQEPYFLQPLQADKTDVCSGETVILTAQVARATYYEFQMLDQNQWIRLSSGSTDTTAFGIEHRFHSAQSAFLVRILLKNSHSEVVGQTLEIRVHQPSFEVHPEDLVQCNGGEVTFRASGAGALSYQWESSADGLLFSPLAVTSKFKDVRSTALKVTGIINGHHGLAFRCRITDTYQCEALSQPAVLSVNQLSSSVSPTTTKPFCEGDTARFFPASVVGNVLSYQWRIRKSGQATYSPLEEDHRFSGTATEMLHVNGILPSENSYRVRVALVARNQNSAGQIDSTVCYLESTRANYTIHPRPARPLALDSLESCGPADFLISGTENYFWYADTLSSPLKSGSPFYQTSRLDTSRVYFYAIKDDKGCESSRQPVSVFVRSVPEQTFSVPDGICTEQIRIPLQTSNIKHQPLYFYIHSPDFPADSLPAASRADIAVPFQKSSGQLTLWLHSKNEYCSSDTTELPLRLFPTTQIYPSLQDTVLCEGEPLRLQAGYSAKDPVLTWYREGAGLQSSPADTFFIPAVTPAHQGSYSVTVTGQCGEAHSAPFRLVVRPAVVFQAHPQDTAVCENEAAVFRAKAVGSEALHYRWSINGQPVPGDKDSLLLPRVTSQLNGARIVCTVSSSCPQEIISDTATLTVRPLPPLPLLSDTLRFCTSGATVNLAEASENLNWYDSEGQLLPSPEVIAKDTQVFSASKTDSFGCESQPKTFTIRVSPAFTLALYSEREKLCLSGNFNRSVSIGTFSSSPHPVHFYLRKAGQPLEDNSTGHFTVQEPGSFTVEGIQGHCSALDSLLISGPDVNLSAPPSVTNTTACYGQTTALSAASEYTAGLIYWWSHPTENQGFATGNQITLPATDTTLYASYGLQFSGLFCESPRTEVQVKTLPRLRAGTIAEHHLIHCTGYNPPQISSLKSPEHFTHIQWQSTENCDYPLWRDIPGATDIHHNPGMLQTTTCFRRKVWNTCDTLYSNAVTMTIVRDPSLIISADKDTVLAADSLMLYALLEGGAGQCTVQWQINPVSGAASNPNWADLSQGFVLKYANPDYAGVLHFRARISCDLSSCNLSTSNAIAVCFLPPLTPLHLLSHTEQMTNCYGNVSSLTVQAEGMGKLHYQWQRKLPGETSFTNLQDNSYLSGTQTNTLRIAATGNEESLHESRFRCLVSDTAATLHSPEIPLEVNRLTGSLPNQTLCAGNDLLADLRETFVLNGVPQRFEWQYRPGTGYPWTALSDTGTIRGSSTVALRISALPELEQFQYRCAVTFASGSGTCVETTDLMTLKVGMYPEKPTDRGISVCQDQKMEEITLYPPEGLKVTWYNLHQEAAVSQPPSIDTDIPGDYFMQYAYLTDKKCESPRALIRVTVHPAPSSPHNTTPEVYDETETLVFSAAGQNLKWYRTRTLQQFETYPPVFSSTGKKSYYVTQTDVRGCESQRLLIQSEIRPVFRITAQPENQINCGGNTVTFGVRVSGGSDVSYQWQRDHYGLFGDIAGATARDYKVSDTGISPDTTGARYRCIIRSGERMLISEPAVLIVNELRPSLPGLALCTGDALDLSAYRDSIRGIPLSMEWQRRSGSSYETVFEANERTETRAPEAIETGTYRLRVTFQTSGGTCVRNSNAISVRQHARPASPTDTLRRICRFSPPEEVLPPHTWWRGADEKWKRIPEISTREEKKYSGSYKIEGENGCFSEPVHLMVQVEPCYFPGQVDTTVSIPMSLLHSDDWNYLYLENGEIFAAIHPQGQTLSPFTAQLRSTALPALTDSVGNRFYPRSLSLQATHPAPVKIRFFLSESEWLTYPTRSEEVLTLLHRSRQVQPSDNTLWLKDTLQWHLSASHRYVEFETSTPGDYLLWNTRLPSGRLSLGKDLRNYPFLLAENLRPMPDGQYVIRKSADGRTWQEEWRGISSNQRMEDTNPYQPKTHYQLDFDFGTKIWMALDSGEADFTNSPPLCRILDHPFTDNRTIRLYFPGLEKDLTKLVSLQGRDIPILLIAEEGDHYRIKPAVPLHQGSYYLITTNQAGQPCTKRIIIY